MYLIQLAKAVAGQSDVKINSEEINPIHNYI